MLFLFVYFPPLANQARNLTLQYSFSTSGMIPEPIVGAIN